MATDQEVLGSTPSRRTIKKGVNVIKWLIKISLQMSIIYFFLFILIILMVFSGLLNPQKIGVVGLVIGHKLAMNKKPLGKEENRLF